MFLAGLLAEAPAILSRWWKLAAGMILGAMLIAPLAHCKGERDGRAELLAEQARAALDATNRADEADEALRNAAENRASDIEGAIRNAVEAHPEETNKAAGPASRAALDELRRRGR